MEHKILDATRGAMTGNWSSTSSRLADLDFSLRCDLAPFSLQSFIFLSLFLLEYQYNPFNRGGRIIQAQVDKNAAAQCEIRLFVKASKISRFHRKRSRQQVTLFP